MFGVGWTEMLLVGVVALVVIGPKDLPVVMRQVGKAIGMIRRLGTEFQREINKTTGLDQITDLRRSITEPLKQTAAEITREFNRATESGTVEPSGAIAPKDPAAESVVSAIEEKAGATATPLMTPLPPVAAPVESPAPAEAVAPVKKAPRARKPAPPAIPKATAEAVTDVAPVAPKKPRVRSATKIAAAAAPSEPAAEAPVVPRTRRRRTPKAEA